MQKPVAANSTDSTADPVLHVQLLRPAPGSRVLPGRTISGIGWLDCTSKVTAVAVHLGSLYLNSAQLGLSIEEVRSLSNIDVKRSDLGSDVQTSTGFVFSAAIPDTTAEHALINIVASTPGGIFTHGTRILLRERAAPAGDTMQAVAARLESPGNEREPVRLLIERANVNDSGILEVSGWAVSTVPIQQAAIFAGERALGHAQLGGSRPDVALQHGAYPNAHESGFLFRRELTDEELAEPFIYVAVTSGPGPRRVYKNPLIRPANIRRRPSPPSIEIECEELFVSEKGAVAVKGWAVCSSGISGITVELDGSEVGTAVVTETRSDVANRFPCIRDAERAGFRLVRALGVPLTGEHVLTLTAHGSAGEKKISTQKVPVQPELPAHLATQLQLPVDAIGSAPGEAASEGDDIRFFLDSPAVVDGVAIEPVSGFMSLAGWAFGRTKIEHVAVFVDGVFQGHAHHGIRREDLQTAFPQYEALLSGFAMVIPPQVMKPGLHQVRLVIRTVAGDMRETAFSIRAEKATVGPGPWQLRSKIPLSEIRQSLAIIAAQGLRPRWLLVIAAAGFKTAGKDALATTITSLVRQAYRDWTAVILAAEADVQATIAALAADPRLAGRARVLSSLSPLCLADLDKDATAIAYLRLGDQLGEDALLEMSVSLALEQKTDLLYCDERRVDPADGELKAFFKPDWSPDLLLSTNYVGHFWAASPTLLRNARIQTSDFANHGNYDIILRMTESAQAVRHVPKVLCERGRFGDDRSFEQKALRRSMRRRGLGGEVSQWAIPGTYRIKRPVEPGGMVSIIIPTNASRGYIETAIKSIRQHTTWPSYEIICIDNIPEPGTAEQQKWKAWIAENSDRTICISSAFNWSRFNNRGVKAARGDYLLFLNDDIEIHEGDWLTNLIEQVQRPEIGVVGPQLTYPDGRVQHAGMFLARRAARHAFRFYPKDAPGYFGLARTQRDVASVTGACLMVRRDVFDAVGGFNERHSVVNNDLDFNLRVRAAGYAVLYTPWVSLTHHEMVSRSKLADVYNSRIFEADWGDLFSKGDPYYSPLLSTDYDDYLPDTEFVEQFNVAHPMIERNSVKRILALKLDHIGDFITAFPAFRRIKQKFPAAELVVLAAKASQSLASLEPAIDRMIEFNFYHARSEKGQRTVSSKELLDLQSRLNPETFDLAIDLRRQPDTRPVLKYTGARWLAGFDRGYAHPWLDFSVEFEGDLARHPKREHVVTSLVHLIDAIDTNCETDPMIIRNPETQLQGRKVMVQALKKAGYDWGEITAPLVCVHTGAGAVNKQWPGESFAGLIDLLVSELGARVVIIGGPEEGDFANAVLKRVRHQKTVASLVGKTGLKDLPHVLSAADLYVGNDSGPKHLAAALGVATIGIHSGSVDAGEWGPIGDKTLTIARRMTCSPCYLALAKDCHRGLACLTGISVGDVFRASRNLLALAGKTTPTRQVARTIAVPRRPKAEPTRASQPNLP